ncbi:cysteine-rich CWC family protein [Prosthecochloris sp. HL-130-GSB]|uniref:Cysteine-rich CWC n=1 Tax=Prosthecochloris aestuarii TaxID=1102 RepID=A0A831SRF8_PROAE|nr:cysteine-rich CWC family protein [Prosthecochloris sp. HL-130-GSB]ARM30662.1 hypothetical protein B9H02_04115 [Prosthecochloris sp. HL-130-GSB]MBO8092730.1 cysteine-rich CWC family protein [Prosthecochloris sp.]HED30603.1 hypothetical protein [Prosthecochloris aestuarii]
MDNQQAPVRVTCPRCGQEFECSRSDSCWCATMEVPEAVLTYLGEHYDTCVCRRCLEELIVSPAGSRTVRRRNYP